MKKTKEYSQKEFEIYMEGRKAAQENKPRFAPYRMENHVQTWFAGYNSVEQNTKLKPLTSNRK
jgi:hypothetical protein